MFNKFCAYHDTFDTPLALTIACSYNLVLFKTLSHLHPARSATSLLVQPWHCRSPFKRPNCSIATEQYTVSRYCYCRCVPCFRNQFCFLKS